MQNSQEIPLLGGQLTPGIVRVGNTVHRPPKSNAAFVHELLLTKKSRSFSFAPRFLGMDEQGREILSYLEGHTFTESGSGLSDDLLVQAARVIRRLHDVIAGSQLAQGHEIVAHNELGPHNTILFRGRSTTSFTQPPTGRANRSHQSLPGRGALDAYSRRGVADRLTMGELKWECLTHIYLQNSIFVRYVERL
jgi:hypothetical protein